LNFDLGFDLGGSLFWFVTACSFTTIVFDKFWSLDDEDIDLDGDEDEDGDDGEFDDFDDGEKLFAFS
jgi:hypothetical protein